MAVAEAYSKPSSMSKEFNEAIHPQEGSLIMRANTAVEKAERSDDPEGMRKDYLKSTMELLSVAKDHLMISQTLGKFPQEAKSHYDEIVQIVGGEAALKPQELANMQLREKAAEELDTLTRLKEATDYDLARADLKRGRRFAHLLQGLGTEIANLSDELSDGYEQETKYEFQTLGDALNVSGKIQDLYTEKAANELKLIERHRAAYSFSSN